MGHPPSANIAAILRLLSCTKLSGGLDDEGQEKRGHLRKDAGAWSIEGDADAAAMRSNLFSMEWPPRSGKLQEFPEVDRAEWFALPEARHRISPGQAPLLDQLETILRDAGS
jgi:predicted NUDIX family NTP pyrophosphohydrolase